MRIVGMILAAGASRRFGRSNKLLAPFRGQALVLHAADVLRRAPVNELLAVTSDPQVAALLPEFHQILGEKLLSQNISRGAAWAKSQSADRLLVVLGDMPFVTPAHCDQLIERCSDTIASASSSSGVRSPPACFPSTMFDDLIALTGDRGAKLLIDAIPPPNVIDASGGELLDIDTRGEFEALKKNWSAKPG